uniref:Uncharacterized protein n=1 Tax=Anguilla anguilla TaxID=7936 RepID=A0A0E9PFM9_ANGAN
MLRLIGVHLEDWLCMSVSQIETETKKSTPEK